MANETAAPDERRGTQVALGGPLEGSHVWVLDDEITFGDLEDMQSNNAGKVLDVVLRRATGWDRSAKWGREALRGLTVAEGAELVKAVGSAAGGQLGNAS